MRDCSFDFNGKNSFDEFGIVCTFLDTIFPDKREQKIQIPNRSGKYNFGSDGFDERPLTLRCYCTNEITRAQFRDISFWLSKKGRLVLWDEPDKYYNAEVFKMPQLSPDTYCNMQYFDVTFTCEPFACGEAIAQDLNTGVNVVNYNGTAETPVQMVFDNLGETAVLNIQITFLDREE